MAARTHPLHVSLVAMPETMISTISGIYDVLNSVAVLAPYVPNLPDDPPFHAEIVTASQAPVTTASGLTLPGRAFEDIAATDIVIVPSLMPENAVWVQGRYPELVAWLGRMRAGGALLASACTGILLMAETGLFDGREVTIHPQLRKTCEVNYPQLKLYSEHVLVTSGENEEFVTSGASTNWHDLVLYLIARYVGPNAAIEMARFFALQCHDKGQALYAVFAPPMDHDDAAVRKAQDWVRKRFNSEHPIENMVSQSGLAARTFKRRFHAATGWTPMNYLQRLRVEAAKRRLERTEDSVEEIAAAVGYHDPTFFRRLFKRLTDVSPGVYRQQLHIPRPVRQAA